MISKDLTRLLGEQSLATRMLRRGFRAYKRGVWAVFDFAYGLWERWRRREPAPPTKARAVLHVSMLSHKPYMLSRIMRRHGVKSDYLAVHPEAGWLQVGTRGYDFALPGSLLGMPLRPFFEIRCLLKMLADYDVIHYHFASLLTYEGRELKYLKRAGKCVVFHFRGCDLRQGSVNRRLHPELNCCAECDSPTGSCETEIQSLRIELAREYADLLFVTTPDLLDFLPEAELVPFIAPTEVVLADIRPAPRNANVFRVVTSSNHDGIDGTAYVRRAVERLQQEGHAIELVEVHGTPYEQALAVYKSADLYAGKLLMGFYNNANIECMLLGVPCMTYIRPEFQGSIPDCPIIVARPDTLYGLIRQHMNEREALRALGERGPAFVHRHHDSDRVVDLILARYDAVLRRRSGRSAPR